VGAQVWVEAVPVQTDITTVIVHLRKGDNKQYRDILDICIEQDVEFDIHDYLQEEVNE
jgi:arabinogalactan endo-1,4-beta-galactosidase